MSTFPKSIFRDDQTIHIPIELKKAVFEMANTLNVQLIQCWDISDKWTVACCKEEDQNKLGDIVKLIETYNAIHEPHS